VSRIAAQSMRLAALLALTLLPGTASAGRSCDVLVNPSEDVAAAVERAPVNASICLASGEYRIVEPLLPKAGQTIEGLGHATLNGAQRLTGFSAVGGTVWAARFYGELGPRTGQCKPKTGNACQLPSAVFRDGKPLRRVTSRGALEEETFWVAASKHEVYVYGNPAGHSLEIALAPAAIIAEPGSPAPVGVTIRGLTVKMFATPAQHGAIDAPAAGWTIVDDRAELNHGAGITSEGEATIEHDRAVDNGQEGIGGSGNDTVVEGNLIADNNWAEFSPEWEAGGAKWGYASDLLVRGNTVRDNKGPGLWSDVDSTGVTYEDNTVTDNELAGIMYEISEQATISYNTVRGNGFGFHVWLWGAGILLAASHNVVVSDNTVTNNANAITLVQQERGVSERNGLPRVLHNIGVERNIELMGEGATGMVQDDGDDAIFEPASMITFTDNTYLHYPPASFFWDNRELEPAEWQAFGNDVEGVFKGESH
jgi:parallel beta-helix repeat protein